MNALVNRLSASLVEVRNQFESSSSLAASFIGGVLGIFVTLAIVVVIGLFIGRSFPWVTFALGIVVSIATFYTILEVFLAISMYRHTLGELSRDVVPYVIAMKLVELAIFVVAALVLFHVLTFR